MNKSHRKKRKRLQKHVEFVGLPTAGKTTVYTTMIDDGVFDEHNLHPITVDQSARKLKKYPIIMALFFSHIVDVMFVTVFFLRYTKYNQLNFRRWRSIVRLILLTAYETKGNSYDFFMHNGILHLLLDIEFRPSVKRKDVLRTFWLRFEPHFDSVVMIDLSLAEFRRRMKERMKTSSHTRRHLVDAETREEWLKRSMEQYQKLREVILETSDTPTLVVTGEDKVVDKVELVKEHLLEQHG